MDVIRILLIIAAIASAVMCIYFALTHEPDEQTLEFTSDPDTGEITSDSLSYCMVFTGERADKVEWDFGDGTTAEATTVFKTYDEPGDYYVLCKATNSNGERFSAYSLHITESEHGLLDGYGREIALLVTSVVLMLTSWFMRS